MAENKELNELQKDNVPEKYLGKVVGGINLLLDPQKLGSGGDTDPVSGLPYVPENPYDDPTKNNA